MRPIKFAGFNKPCSLMEMQLKELKPFSQKVFKRIYQSYGFEMPTLNHIADQLCISNRTLQRKLKIEKTTYRELLVQVKIIFAISLEHEKLYKPKEIAYALGYCSTSSYLHARSQWQKNCPFKQ